MPTQIAGREADANRVCTNGPDIKRTANSSHSRLSQGRGAGKTFSPRRPASEKEDAATRSRDGGRRTKKKRKENSGETLGRQVTDPLHPTQPPRCWVRFKPPPSPGVAHCRRRTRPRSLPPSPSLQRCWVECSTVHGEGAHKRTRRVVAQEKLLELRARAGGRGSRHLLEPILPAIVTRVLLAIRHHRGMRQQSLALKTFLTTGPSSCAPLSLYCRLVPSRWRRVTRREAFSRVCASSASIQTRARPRGTHQSPGETCA